AVAMYGRRRRRYWRRAVDSGATSTNFTIAEESRYVTRSTLIGAQPSQDRRGRLLAWCECQRFGQLAHLAAGTRDLPLDQHSPIRAARRQRREHRHGSSAISDLDTLASLDLA